MIHVADLGTYLHDLGLDPTVPVLPGALISIGGVAPTRGLFITPTGGPGLLLEGATDVISYQFRWRSDQGNAADAYADGEQFAKTTDDMLVTAVYPTVIGGRQVIRLNRVGGSPAYLATTDRRAHFTCNYLFEIAIT